MPLTTESRIVVGSSKNFWTWSRDSGWDLTHPSTPASPPVQQRLRLSCHISNVTIDPAKTALLIIDMQNFSMSSALGEADVAAISQAEEVLLQHAIPAAHKANIQIIWLNWGLDKSDLESLPPAASRVFGWDANCNYDDYGIFSPSLNADGIEEMIQCGELPTGKCPGDDLGEVVLPDGTKVQAGRVLMKGTWNADLHGPLLSAYQKGRAKSRPDVIIYKNRNSGLYSSSCELAQFLEKEGIRTLLFTGMNTDQCVMGTLQDAHSRGFDTILLRDACATSSPSYTQQSAEWNCCIPWGFLSSCKALATAACVTSDRESMQQYLKASK